MNQRMEDALSLMEDILSAELPSVSAPLHTTAANRRPYPSTVDKPPVCRRTADDVINIATEYGGIHGCVHVRLCIEILYTVYLTTCIRSCTCTRYRHCTLHVHGTLHV